MKENITNNTKEAREFFAKINSFLTSPFELKDMIKNKLDGNKYY